VDTENGITVRPSGGFLPAAEEVAGAVAVEAAAVASVVLVVVVLVAAEQEVVGKNFPNKMNESSLVKDCFFIVL
jgi:hypothetical protein